MDLRTASHQDLASIRDLLAQARLPIDDIDDPAIAFVVAEATGAIGGVVGVQACGAAGLLRSLAVRDGLRGRGLGTALLRAAESLARARSLAPLVLLTQTAEPYFARHGYRVIERGAAPEAVRRSAEFRSICPASATCMAKDPGPLEMA